MLLRFHPIATLQIVASFIAPSRPAPQTSSWTLNHRQRRTHQLSLLSRAPFTITPHHITMRFSTTAVLALPALALAEQQIPLLDKVKGFFNQATASVASVIPSAPSVPSAPVEAAAAKAAAAVQHPLTLENWKEVLTVDPTVSPPATTEWLVFVTGGNSTCYGFCGPAEKAWNVRICDKSH